MIRELRFLIAEKLLSWAFNILPSSEEKIKYGIFLLEYTDKYKAKK